ncbi:trypsin-1 isoform X2 [Megalopta genalis]|uniref:trypsin-1 isoform X2 n=1 Tax=Megalopta genalis TaxID=115081 RepID=UPI003FCEF4A1
MIRRALLFYLFCARLSIDCSFVEDSVRVGAASSVANRSRGWIVDDHVDRASASNGTEGTSAESFETIERTNTAKIVWQKEEEEEEAVPVISGPRACGTSAKSLSRLVGGQPAGPTEWPWMAALLRKDESRYCGGVLITDRHVLTAAHCVYRHAPRDIKVRLGEYDFSAAPEDSRASDFAVSEIRVHRYFDRVLYENDIAIAKLLRPTVFDEHIWPVCLPPIDQTFENEDAVVTGWGTSYYGGPASSVLMEVAVPIWPRNLCARSFVRRIPETMMCAGAYEGGRDACQGDSGGPLLHRLANGRWVNAGIVSWGIRCGEPGRPGVYTRVNAYLDWIFENAVF